jgi:hypothetical protein
LARSAAPLTTALFPTSGKRTAGDIRPSSATRISREQDCSRELSLHYRTEMGEVLLRLCDEYSEYMIGNALERSEAIRAIAG